jgi:hypothetical protein
MPASKTIYVDKDGKKVIVIGDPKKKRLGKKKKGGLDPSMMPQKPPVEVKIDPKTKRPSIQEDQPKSIDPQQVREQSKQEQKLAGERIQKRRMTEDYAYTDKFNTKGPHSRVVEATAKGVRLAKKGGGRAYGKNS